MAETSRGFASDNAASVHPMVLERIAEANQGHAHAYGDDGWTRRAEALIRRHFGEDARFFPVFNGTGANVTSLQTLMRPFEAVICAESAHINEDECGAPERFTGGKLLPAATPDGKLTPELVVGAVRNVGFEHASQARVVSITQSSEYGTVYSRDELSAIADAATSKGLRLHVDGARLANAAAALGCDLGEACEGADVVSFGLTKNGAMLAEAVIVREPVLAEDFKYIRKQSAQLASKMRFISAQFVAMLEDGLWRDNAAHANEMAQLLVERVSDIPGVRIMQQVQANEVFAELPEVAVADLQSEVDFYRWTEGTGEVRWVTSWDTTQSDVERLAASLERRLGKR